MSWVFPMITGSQAVPVITFLKFSFWKTKHKKNHCLDMFFIYQNLYCFKNSNKQLFRWHLFLCQVCCCMNCQEGSQQFDSVFYLCLVIRTSCCVFELNDWGVSRCVCWGCTCTCVTVCVLWVCACVTDMTGCIANWITQCYRSGKAGTQL